MRRPRLNVLQAIFALLTERANSAAALVHRK